MIFGKSLQKLHLIRGKRNMDLINFCTLILIMALVKITLSAPTFNGDQLRQSKGRVARQIFFDDYDNQIDGYYGDDEQLYQYLPHPIYHHYEHPFYHYQRLHPEHKKLFVMNTFG